MHCCIAQINCHAVTISIYHNAEAIQTRYIWLAKLLGMHNPFCVRLLYVPLSIRLH